MIRHHRLWEAFLHDELGLSWDQVHDEAERLEHACSDALIDKIEEKLGFPSFDPHGNPIPDRDGHVPYLVHEHVLPQAKIGRHYKITRVSQLDQEDLAWLAQVGLRLNTTLCVVGHVQKDGSFILRVASGGLVMLSEILAGSICVCDVSVSHDTFPE
jgi:DtxR family transcriptional regulator, Mn-dependent transcriptional regulator